MKESWELLTQGDAEDFVATLCAEALDHPAVHHPYLERIGSGDLPDVAWALRDYAYQYAYYSQAFPEYLEGVIATLTCDAHRRLLLENLEEERGDPGASDLDHVPHTELFARFRRAIGVDDAYLARHKPITTVEVWRDLALQKFRSPQVGVGVGAIGIGTELVVPTIYTYILEGIRDHTTLAPEDYYFFTLHAQCDQAHAADLRQVTVDVASDATTREAIRFGVFSALNLRKAFWDIMLSRALDPARED
jgi:pyrroloquinoline quinone (PQQ) biosynthesis protein C